MSKLRQVDLIERLIEKMKSATLEGQGKGTNPLEFLNCSKCRCPIEMAIYFHELPNLKSAQNQIGGFFNVWGVDEIIQSIRETSAFNAQTGTGYVRFADFELNLIIFALCFEDGRFTGVGSAMSWHGVLKMHTTSLIEFFSAVVMEDFDFYSLMT